jgi:hypothetical protein
VSHFSAETLAEDPPRTDWEKSVEIRLRELDLERIPSQARESHVGASLEKLVLELLKVDAYMAGGVLAIERAQGAELAGEQWAATARQAEARQAFRDCADALKSGAVAIDELLIGRPPFLRGPSVVARVPARLSALPSPVRETLTEIGFDGTDAALYAATMRTHPIVLGPLDRQVRGVKEAMIELAASLAARPGTELPI